MRSRDASSGQALCRNSSRFAGSSSRALRKTSFSFHSGVMAPRRSVPPQSQQQDNAPPARMCDGESHVARVPPPPRFACPPAPPPAPTPPRTCRRGPPRAPPGVAPARGGGGGRRLPPPPLLPPLTDPAPAPVPPPATPGRFHSVVQLNAVVG